MAESNSTSAREIEVLCHTCGHKQSPSEFKSIRASGTPTKLCATCRAKSRAWNRRHEKHGPRRKSTSVAIICAQCTTAFYAAPSRNRRFCSRACQFSEDAPVRPKNDPPEWHIPYPLSDTALGYIAGIVDGEGHLGLSNKNPVRTQPRLIVTNTDRSIMDYISEQIGCGGRWTTYRRNPEHKPAHRWELGSSNLYRLLLQMQHLLISKRELAGLLLEFGHTLGYVGRGVPRCVREHRINIMDQVNALNKRGVSCADTR